MALGEKDLPEIIRELSAAKSKWYNIGIDLKLEVSTLDGIRNDRKDNTDECFPQMIIAWLRSSSEVPKTWSTLADVLKQPMIGFGELATKIEEKYCQPQITTGEKRPYPGDESEIATKRSRLEEGCKCEELKELFLTKDQQIHELISEQNEKLKGLDSSMKDRDAQVQALVKDNKQLRKENATLKRELEEQMKEHSQQLQQLTTQIQKIQNETAKNEMSQVSESTPNLPPTKTTEVDDEILWMRRALHKVRDDWYEIGCEFEVGLQFLDDIKRKHGENSKHCLFLVLREWLTQLVTRGDKECKTCKLTEVLRSPLLEYDQLADTLDDMWHLRCPSRTSPRDNEYYSRFYPF